MMKDISVVNLKEANHNKTSNFAIIATGFSGKHIYNTSKTLLKEIKNLECKEIVNIPSVSGAKGGTWMYLQVKEVQVHMLV